MLIAYFTPEVALPVASVIAASFGFLMMIGKAPFRLLARAFKSRGKEQSSPSKPTDA